MDAKTKRAMTRSPLAVARTALHVASQALPLYSSKFSRRDFTQSQLLAILVLQQFVRTDYRTIVQYLDDWSDVRQALGLTKVPHYSTLAYAAKRLLKKGSLSACWPPSLPRPKA